MKFNILIAYSIQLFHLLLCVFAFIAPYLTNNTLYLSCFIFYYAIVLTLWYINGGCFITNIENELKEEKYSKKSYVSNLFSNILGKHTKTVIAIVPLLNITVCLYKINLNKNK